MVLPDTLNQKQTISKQIIINQGVEDLLNKHEDGTTWGILKNTAIEKYLVGYFVNVNKITPDLEKFRELEFVDN